MNRIILSTHASTLQDMLLHAIQQLDIDLQPKIKEEVMSRCEVLIDRGNAIISIELPQDDEALEVQTRLEDIAVSIISRVFSLHLMRSPDSQLHRYLYKPHNVLIFTTTKSIPNR